MMSFRVSPHVHYRSLDGEGVLLDSRGDVYLGLNGTGAVIWESVATGGTVEDAARELTTRFEVSLEQARADVESFVERLTSRGILEPASP